MNLHNILDLTLKFLVDKHKIILFSLNSLIYPELAHDIGSLLVQDLKEFSTTKPKEKIINIFLDEFNVFATDSVVNMINKTRSYNYNCFLAFQTINDLKTKNKDITDTIFGNVGNIICHNVKDKNTTEYVAATFGTVKKMKLTRQLNFLDRTRHMGSVREAEEFMFHPNDFKNLLTGVANVRLINHNDLKHFDMRKVKVIDFSKMQEKGG